MYGGEGGGYCHVSQIYERQQFEVVKGDFWLECLTIFATGCSSVAFVRRVDHSIAILSCNLIVQRENKSFYVTEIVLRLGYADVIFRRRESRQPEIRLRSQARTQ